MALQNAELLETYNGRPSTGRGIIFGKGAKAKEEAESFAAYATEHGAIAIVILDERKHYFVAERDGRIPVPIAKVVSICETSEPMRKKLVITLDLEDSEEEGFNWLADTIALENVIRDRLEEAGTVTVHDISITEQG